MTCMYISISIIYQPAIRRIDSSQRNLQADHGSALHHHAIPLARSCTCKVSSFFNNNTDDCMLQRPGTVTIDIYTHPFSSVHLLQGEGRSRLGRLPCFRHCLASLELLSVQPRLPLVPGSDKSVRQGSACRSAGEEAPPTADRPQKSKPSPCRPHGFVAPVGEGTRRSVHADSTGSSVRTSRSPHSYTGGFCRNEALLTSLHVPRQRNVRCPVSELTYMSAIDDLYKHNLHRATQRAAQCF